MGIFLRLGETKLSQAVLRHPGTDGVHDALLGKDGGHERVVHVRVIDHPEQACELRPRTGVEFREFRLADGKEDLPRPVGAEVEAEHAVAFGDPAEATDHGRGE